MNEKTKHTPGPWDVDYSGPARLAIIDPTGAIIALGNMQNHDGDVDEANARLIASAPDLLAALEKIADETAATWVTDVARAAIAKARGEKGGGL